MDSFRRALRTNEKAFSNFELSAENRKIFKVQCIISCVKQLLE